MPPYKPGVKILIVKARTILCFTLGIMKKKPTLAQDCVLPPSYSLTEPQTLPGGAWTTTCVKLSSLCKTTGHHPKDSLRSQAHAPQLISSTWQNTKVLRTWGLQKPLRSSGCSSPPGKSDRFFDKGGSTTNRAHSTVRGSLFNLPATKTNETKSSTELPENKWEKGDAWFNPATLLLT